MTLFGQTAQIGFLLHMIYMRSDYTSIPLASYKAGYKRATAIKVSTVTGPNIHINV